MKASIRSRVMVGVLGLALLACGDSTDTVDDLTSTTSGDNGTTTTAPATTTSAEAPTCSAAGLTVRSDAQPEDLPAEVAKVRSELLAAATGCDVERLGSKAEADGTSYTFGGGFDPAAYWGDLETNGETPLADLVRLLELEPALYDVGEGSVYYVWPAVYALPDWSDATEEQRQELADLFGADQLAGWDSFGGYIGYRVGITIDGRWAFFVAGD